MMNARGKSDRPIVPTKLPNKAVEPAAEAVEGGGLAKGNLPEGDAFRTPCRGNAQSALERVRQAARSKRKQRFTALLHQGIIQSILPRSRNGMRGRRDPVREPGRKLRTMHIMLISLRYAPAGGGDRSEFSGKRSD